MAVAIDLSKKRRRPEAAARIEARRRRKREQILNAAQRILDERGPHDMSLRAVAREVGCAPATLYEYYRSLHDLLDGLAERPRNELRAYLAAAADDSTGMASDLMIRLGIAYVRFARRRPKAFRLLFETLAPATAKRDREQHLAAHPVVKPLIEAAHLGQLTGEIHPEDDAERIAWGLWGLAHGLATLRAAGAPAPESDPDGADISVLQAYVGGWVV